MNWMIQNASFSILLELVYEKWHCQFEQKSLHEYNQALSHGFGSEQTENFCTEICYFLFSIAAI